MQSFGITRQAVNRHVRQLIDQGHVEGEGSTRRRTLRLVEHQILDLTRPIRGLEEDLLWSSAVGRIFSGLSESVRAIWHYGFTEMVNNVADHSGGTTLSVTAQSTALGSTVMISDDGLGIFHKIQTALRLDDERHAVLELSKGKLTTNPDNHTGEGIFFTSRLFDTFAIHSGSVYFTHRNGEHEDWILEAERPKQYGTGVILSLANDCSRTAQGVFDMYAKGEDFTFARTVVPVQLMRRGTEQLVSRSQAKRLLARFDRFKVVILDFAGIDSVGPAFADEVFRVFARVAPACRVVPTWRRRLGA